MRGLRLPDHLTFVDKGVPATEKQLSKAEKDLGRTIPRSYRLFLSHHNACRVDPPNFKISARRGKKAENASVSWFLGVDVMDMLNVVGIAELFRGRLPVHLLAIARDPGGNLICMDGSGAVFFWDHEHDDVDDDAGLRTRPTSKPRRVAGSFGAFLASLAE